MEIYVFFTAKELADIIASPNATKGMRKRAKKQLKFRGLL
jgi:hypothetical protein